MSETENCIMYLANLLGIDIKFEPESSPLKTSTDRVLARIITQTKILKQKYRENEDIINKLRKAVDILIQHVNKDDILDVSKDEVLDAYGNPWPFENVKCPSPENAKTIGFRRALSPEDLPPSKPMPHTIKMMKYIHEHDLLNGLRDK